MRGTTLGEWLDTWMELYVKPAGLAKNTVSMYNRAVRAVPEELRSKPLAALSDLDVMPWLVAVAREHPRAAQLDRLMLRRALKVAGKLGLCARGLIDDDTCPQIRHQAAETAVLTLEELRRYLAAALTTEGPEGAILAFCACGLRRGEARGVTWGDIDLQTGVLQIKAQRQGQGQRVPLKTRSSTRDIVLPSAVVRFLHQRRNLPGAFVSDLSENSIYRLHRRVCCAAKCPPVTLHGLRHSVATACVAQGDAMKSVQGLLGHADFSLTANIYANHLFSASDLCEKLFA